jgi:hypothetical protein
VSGLPVQPRRSCLALDADVMALAKRMRATPSYEVEHNKDAGTIKATLDGQLVYRGLQKDGPGHWIVSYSTEYFEGE